MKRIRILENQGVYKFQIWSYSNPFEQLLDKIANRPEPGYNWSDDYSGRYDSFEEAKRAALRMVGPWKVVTQ
jgi:hypothetical protein